MIRYKRGNVLRGAPEGVVLAHACNALGSWGSGIARQFKTKYPIAYALYEEYCTEAGKYKNIVGSCKLITGNTNDVACLITSQGYGKFVDNKHKIIEATTQSIKDLISQIEGDEIEIHSPKINSGLFKVPWQYTAEAITQAIDSFEDKNIKWIVWEL